LPISISIMMAVRVPLMTRTSPSAIVDSGPSDGGMTRPSASGLSVAINSLRIRTSEEI
jgi:hypothetical protein